MPREREEKSFFNFEKHENAHRVLVFKKNVPAGVILAGRERSEKKI